VPPTDDTSESGARPGESDPDTTEHQSLMESTTCTQQIESISPEILLAPLQCASKVAQQRTESWCLLWVCHGIEGQDSQAQGDVLKSQQGIGEGLSSKSTSGQGGHRSDATDLRVPRFRADGLCTLCITGGIPPIP